MVMMVHWVGRGVMVMPMVLMVHQVMPSRWQGLLWLLLLLFPLKT